MKHRQLALYGLKFNPFSPEIPTEALYPIPAINDFCWRIKEALIHQGGFAMVCGQPGTGKSVTLRLLADELSQIHDIQVGAITHPSAKLADFYREMGDLFGVELSVHNRWGGFKALRERWLQHIESTLIRPVLLIDEAQEMPPIVLAELRLLAAMHFDSKLLLTVVLAGDQRLANKLRREELLPLGSRIRVRLNTEHAKPKALRETLDHLLHTAGAPQLMTDPLKNTLCDHAMGNYRVLVTLAAELLDAATQRERPQIDEKLFFECFTPNQRTA